ncbi:MAG: helix-turn-helix domain-containing protein [Actinomycetota bacterium]
MNIRGVEDSDFGLLTVSEVAQILRLSRARLYELIAAGTLPSVRIGHARRIRRSDLKQFIAQLGQDETTRA